MRTIDVADLGQHLGEEMAVSEWLEISQSRIDRFAEATGDHQWIHVDPGRAAAALPERTTIAHGFLTLALVTALLQQGITIGRIRMAINYGLDRVRFVSPLPAGARVRGRFTLAAVAEAGGGIQVTWSVTVEREHGDRPCCVAEWLVRYYPVDEAAKGKIVLTVGGSTAGTAFKQ
ncbi:MAG: MaoC family dehydratase [Acidobacteriota bacterium]